MGSEKVTTRNPRGQPEKQMHGVMRQWWDFYIICLRLLTFCTLIRQATFGHAGRSTLFSLYSSLQTLHLTRILKNSCKVMRAERFLIPSCSPPMLLMMTDDL